MHRTPTKFVATKKAALDLAAKSTSFSLMEALCIMSKFINSSSLDDRTEISNHNGSLFPGQIRSLEIYSNIMWFTCEVSTYIILIFADHIITGNACIC